MALQSSGELHRIQVRPELTGQRTTAQDTFALFKDIPSPAESSANTWLRFWVSDICHDKVLGFYGLRVGGFTAGLIAPMMFSLGLEVWVGDVCGKGFWHGVMIKASWLCLGGYSVNDSRAS